MLVYKSCEHVFSRKLLVEGEYIMKLYLVKRENNNRRILLLSLTVYITLSYYCFVIELSIP